MQSIHRRMMGVLQEDGRDKPGCGCFHNQIGDLVFGQGNKGAKFDVAVGLLPMISHFGVGEFATHCRIYFSGWIG